MTKQFKKYTLLILIALPSLSFSQAIIQEELQLKNEEIELPGTLSFPESKRRIPLAIFVHGSGNIDRNGNQSGLGVQANYIKILADSLNKKGIAFYRYDKRTSTISNLDKLENITIHSFANDAKVAIEQLKKDKRFGPLYLIGHSQGSLVAMLSITPEIRGFISLAGPSETVDKIISKQLHDQNPDLAKLAGEHFQELMSTDTILNVHPFLMSLFAPMNQNFFKSWVLLNPSEEIKKIKIPILLLNGEEDLQVKKSNLEQLMASQPSANATMIPRMNHVLKEVNSLEENQTSYYKEDFPLSTQLVDLISTFIKSKKNK